VSLTKADFALPPASGLRATWLGHSTVLVEIDGARILFDPVWARRASPSSLIGPKRFHEPPLALDQLPPLDAIVASHDHYDHLDRGVVRALAGAQRSRAPASSFRSASVRTWSDGVSPRIASPSSIGPSPRQWGRSSLPRPRRATFRDVA